MHKSMMTEEQVCPNNPVIQIQFFKCEGGTAGLALYSEGLSINYTHLVAIYNLFVNYLIILHKGKALQVHLWISTMEIYLVNKEL